MKKNLIIAIIGLFAIAGLTAQAQSVHYKAADAATAFRIYNGYTGDLTFVVQGTGGTQYTASADGNLNTIAAKTNMNVLVPAILGVTNAAGQSKLVVDASQALNLDFTTNALLAGTYTAASGAWVDVLWDTSGALFYQASVPAAQFFDRDGEPILGRVAQPFKVKKIYGDVTGTGNVTLKVYVDGSEKYSRVFPSPVLSLGANGTGATTNDLIALDVDAGIPVGSQSSVIVRALRATTATNGNIGFTAE